MGISGLLPAIRGATRRMHVRELAGETVAVDAYSWLHRGVSTRAAAEDVLAGREPRAPVEYCMARVQQLRAFRVEPLLVFDGGPLPMKAGREAARAASRAAARERALAARSRGDAAGALAAALRALDVTPRMAARLIGALRAANVPYVVAPYEADAQMAFLAAAGRVAAVVTEDSDLLCFGAARVLFKLDAAGYADEVVLSRLLGEKRGSSPPIVSAPDDGTQLDVSRLSHEQFRHMCILSGCDYAPSVPGIGLRTAHRLVLRGAGCLDRLFSALRREAGARVPADYVDVFLRADLTFQHQRVWDAARRAAVLLSPLSGDASPDALDFLGPALPSALAEAIALGNACPVTHVPFSDEDLYGVRVLRASVPLGVRALSTAAPAAARAVPVLAPETPQRPRQMLSALVYARGQRLTTLQPVDAASVSAARHAISCMSRSGAVARHCDSLSGSSLSQPDPILSTDTGDSVPSASQAKTLPSSAANVAVADPPSADTARHPSTVEDPPADSQAATSDVISTCSQAVSDTLAKRRAAESSQECAASSQGSARSQLPAYSSALAADSVFADLAAYVSLGLRTGARRDAAPAAVIPRPPAQRSVLDALQHAAATRGTCPAPVKWAAAPEPPASAPASRKLAARGILDQLRDAAKRRRVAEVPADENVAPLCEVQTTARPCA